LVDRPTENNPVISEELLLQAVPDALVGVTVPGWGEPLRGKVRDIYLRDGQRILITSDRVSAFDRVLGLIPFKGQVLNQLSAWWFENTADIVRNHLIAVPDPNVTIAAEAQLLPVEIVVRGYITGVTKTSLWYLYEQGDRQPYGIPLPDGLRKNDPLPQPIITPTTKAEMGGHDQRLTRQEILDRCLVAEPLWDEIEKTAVALFRRGQQLAARAGLVLVDTKYEMGLVDGRLTIVDEIHTPDSSRYWLAESLHEDAKPQNYDKEFLRKWYAAQDYRGDGTPPQMPAEFVASVAARYIAAYERITGRTFEPAEQPAEPRIITCLHNLYNGNAN
jgi:phosphoribosylaminoimidazole-succinocarboxamide synthase